MSPPALRQTLDILLVDDDAGDCRLVQESLRESKYPAKVHVVNNGDEALAYLRGQGEHKKASRPDLVLLDLNMPKKDGFSTLKDIRADRYLTDIPVIILTTSTDEKDVQQSYKLHASSFVSKPTRLEDFGRVMREIEAYWGGTARVPRPA